MLIWVDFVVDCLMGEFIVEDVCDWYFVGEFNVGGCMFCYLIFGDWFDLKYGCMLEVGWCENGKMFCVYEKGCQLGDIVSLWIWFEVEF